MARSIVLVAIALLLSGCGKTLYDIGAEQLRKDPALRAEAIRDCVKDTASKSRFERQLLADGMKVRLARVPEVFCRRVISAVASGRLSYAELQDDQSDEVLKVIEGR